MALSTVDGVDEIDWQLGEVARRWLDLPEVLPAERGGGLRRDCQHWLRP